MKSLLISEQRARTACKFSITLLLLTLFSIPLVRAQTDILQRRVTVQLGTTTIAEALDALEKETGYEILYSPSEIETQRKVNVSYKNTSLIDILQGIVGDAARRVAVEGRQIKIQPSAGRGNVTGSVRTSDGQPAGYVTVGIKGRWSTQADMQGHFTLEGIEAGTYTISASFLGLETQQETVTVTPNTTRTVNFTLSENNQTLQEVVVNAQRNSFVAKESAYVAKIPLAALENAQSYSTVSKELMAQQLTFNVTDAIKNVPGISYYGTSTPYLSVNGSLYSQRGFTTQAQARNGLAALFSTDIDASNVEKVEVIKGPSATLFGSNISSYGGLINVVTKKPFETFGGEVRFTSGSYGLNRMSVDVNAPLDAEKKMLFRVNAAYSSQHTFQDFGFNRYYNIAPSFSYRVNDRLDFLVDAQFQSGTTAGGAPSIWLFQTGQLQPTVRQLLSAYLPPAMLDQFMTGYPANIKEAFGTDRADELNLDYKRSFISNDVTMKNQGVNFFGQMHYKLSDSWSSQTALSVGNNTTTGYNAQLQLLPNFVFSLLEGISTGQPSFGTPGFVMTRSTRKPNIDLTVTDIQQNFTGDFRLGSMRNRFVGGLDYYHYHSNSIFYRYLGYIGGVVPADGFLDYGPATGPYPGYTDFNLNRVEAGYATGTPDNYLSNAQNDTYSAYVHDVLNITDQLVVSAGLRIDHFRSKGNYDAETDSTSGRYNQTALSPKFGIVYQLLKDRISLFGNYQQGFTNQNGTDYEGNTFHPERSFQWEGGIKVNAINNLLVGTLSYYDIKVRDVLRADPVNIGFQIQDGTQMSRGFEADLILFPFEGMNITAGYAHNNSKYTLISEDLEGLRPVTAGPKNAVNLWATYQIPKGAARGLGFGFGGNYSGENFSINSHTDGQFILPAYTVLNSTIFYERGRFRIAAKVNNLTNKHYWTGYFTISPQMLRQFMGSIAFRF